MENPYEILNQRLSEIQQSVGNLERKFSPGKDKFEKTVLTLPELAKYLSFSHQTIYRIVSRKEIAYSKVGGKLFFKMADIMEYLDQNRIELERKVY